MSTTTVASVSLSGLTIRASDLPSAWGDLGDIPSSKDLDDPPASCAAFAAIFDERQATLIHEFTKDLAPTGDENGHIHMTIVRLAPSADARTAIEAIAKPEYAACAVDTIDRKLRRPDTGPRDATASRLNIRLPVESVGWRVTAPLQNPQADVYYMDIIYLAHGPFLEKLRITRCGCARNTDPLTSDELHPGELLALNATAGRLAAT